MSGVWWYWFTIVLIIVVLLFVGNLERSRVGRAWVAIREDEDAAEIMGVPTFKFKLWAFVIGASIGGLSGALYAGQVQFVVPTGFNVINSVLFLCAVVLGGQGNKLGVILGAFIIVYLPNFFLGRQDILGIPINGDEIAQYKYLFFGLALMVLMIFRPQGLIPVRQKLLAYGRELFVAARKRSQREQAGGGPMSRDSESPHDPGGFEAGAEVGEEYRSHVGGRLRRGPVGPMIEDVAVVVDVADVHPELANPEVVAEIVAPTREIGTEVGKPLVELREVTVQFGGLTALDHVTFDIRRGEILGLIGPNGAGKTTCFNAMTGVYRPTSGTVTFDGQVLGPLKRNQITRLGVARTFQNIRLFSEMTALENVVVGTDARHKTSVPGALFRSPRHRHEERDAIDRGMALLEFVGVGGRRHREGPQPAVRRSAPVGDRPGAGHRTEAALPGRAGRGVQPGGEGRADGPDPQDPVRRLHRAADRTRHAAGDGRHRPDRGARVRQEDRRRPAGRDPRQPGRHRGLPGGPRRCHCLRSAT